jgi:hypothetical protein
MACLWGSRREPEFSITYGRMCLFESWVLLYGQQPDNSMREQKEKTYNSRCSLMVTHSTTNLPVRGLSIGEQTGPRVFHYLWSYVINVGSKPVYKRLAVGSLIHSQCLNYVRHAWSTSWSFQTLLLHWVHAYISLSFDAYKAESLRLTVKAKIQLGGSESSIFATNMWVFVK